MTTGAGRHRGHAPAIVLDRRALAADARPPAGPTDRARHWRRPCRRDRARVCSPSRSINIALAGRAAGDKEQDGPRDRFVVASSRQASSNVAHVSKRPAKDMLGRRTAAGEEGRQGVQHIVEPQQPACRRAPAHRRLVDRGREAARRDRGQHAGEARPGDAEELARRAPLAGRPRPACPGRGTASRGCGAGQGRPRTHRPAPCSRRHRRHAAARSRPAQGPGNGVDFAQTRGDPERRSHQRARGSASRASRPPQGSQPRQASRRASACSRRCPAWAGSPSSRRSI